MASVYRPFSGPRSRLAIRLIAREGRPVHRPIMLPVIGPDDVILPHFDRVLGEYAVRAQLGEIESRNALYLALQPKLLRLATGVRVPTNTAGATGLWDEEDVRQQAFVVFAELIDCWTSDVSFTAFVLSRFTWRLRDAFRRSHSRRPADLEALLSLDEERSEDPALEIVAPPLDDVVDAEALLTLFPDRYRLALCMAAFGGMNKSEIARELGVSRRTVVRWWDEMRRIVRDERGDAWLAAHGLASIKGSETGESDPSRR